MTKIKKISLLCLFTLCTIWGSSNYWLVLKDHHYKSTNDKIQSLLFDTFSNQKKLSEFISLQLTNIDTSQQKNISIFLNQLSNINTFLNSKDEYHNTAIYWLDSNLNVYSPYGLIQDVQAFQFKNLDQCFNTANELILLDPSHTQSSDYIYLGYYSANNEGTVIQKLDISVLKELIKNNFLPLGLTSIAVSSKYSPMINIVENGVSGHDVDLNLEPLNISIKIAYDNKTVNQIIIKDIGFYVLCILAILFVGYLLSALLRLIKTVLEAPIRQAFAIEKQDFKEQISNHEGTINALKDSASINQYHYQEIINELSTRIDGSACLVETVVQAHDGQIDINLTKSESTNLIRNALSELNLLDSTSFIKKSITQFKVANTLQLVQNMLKPILIDKNIQIQTYIDYSASFKSCELVLKQILLIILLKAIDNSPDNSQIDVTVSEVNKNLLIIIKDHGFGMEAPRANRQSSSNKQNIFITPFLEINNELLKQQVSLIHGTLDIDMVIREGTTYKVELMEYEPMTSRQVDNVYFIK